jgi:hypothetical protein
MAPPKKQPRGQVDIACNASPDTVDAGAELRLRVRASAAPPCDLAGHSILVKDEHGAEAGRWELGPSDDATGAAGVLDVKAPLQPGAHVWSASSPAFVKDGTSYAEATAALSFAVRPHATRVLAWDVPPTVVAGEKFPIKVGIKCSAGCTFANKPFAIHGPDGAKIAEGVLTGEVWPGTSGLYFTTLELPAPSTPGLYEWSARAAGADLAVAHDEGATPFGVRVVDPPECLLTLEAFDKEGDTPLPEALVALHPYRAVTDARGRAELRVAKGSYTLFVASPGYLTLGLAIDVTADLTAKAELEREPERERN